MLAQAAQKAGLKPLVIDLWGDQDTRYLAEDIQQKPSLAEDHLLPAIDYFLRRYPVTCVVYGSGFERYPDSLRHMSDRLTLLGNQPETFAKLHDKPAFFSLLKELQLPYPEVSFHRPDQCADWLLKTMQGQGGVGIRRCQSGEVAEPFYYWQKYQEGVPHSVLFLADGKRSQIIGFNRQWTISLNSKDEFIFSGIINSTELSLEQKKQISDWLDKLVLALSLKGLNSLDFIQSGQISYVLEINPRPPASMQLYDADLFARHIKACEGELFDYEMLQDGFTAYQIVYAQQNTQIPDGFAWPEEVVDIPNAGSIIATGQPICSMITHGKEPQQVLEQLQIKQEFITNHTTGFKLMEYSASVNKLTQPLVRYLIDNAGALRLGVEQLKNGCTIIDAGIKVPGGIEAGRIIAEICMGGLGKVSISQRAYTANWPLSVNVYSSNPVLSCLGSQYAGWSLSHEKYYALGSGPARAMATKLKEGKKEPVEELYKELAYQDANDTAALVIENDAVPPLEIIEKVAAACNIAPAKLTIIVTPTSSLAGCVQVVSRVLEVAMHKAHALHFPLENIIDGSGSAPICPPHPKFVKAMGRTNDAILFAGQVHLFVKGTDEAAQKLANDLPSSTSKDYGKPFAEIFKQYEYDFFKIDAMLFSPASVIVTAVESGNSFRAGKLDDALLDQSFGA